MGYDRDRGILKGTLKPIVRDAIEKVGEAKIIAEEGEQLTERSDEPQI